MTHSWLACMILLQGHLLCFGSSRSIHSAQVLPRSLRGAVLGFSSLAIGRKRAVFVTFGSTSLGIPSALARIFARVSPRHTTLNSNCTLNSITDWSYWVTNAPAMFSRCLEYIYTLRTLISLIIITWEKFYWCKNISCFTLLFVVITDFQNIWYLIPSALSPKEKKIPKVCSQNL